jgi:hypothetical protein
MDISDKWDALLAQGVCEQTLQIVTSINGYRSDVMDDILYAHTGLRSFDQIED